MEFQDLGELLWKVHSQLGCYGKEIYELDIHNQPKDIYQDYDCQFRARLTHLTIKQDLSQAFSTQVEITNN